MISNLVIAYHQVDVVHLPIRYDRPLIQQLFYDLSRKLYGGYQSLALNFGNIEMFTLYGSGGSSRLQLLPDRFRVIEQSSGINLEDFKSRFEVVMASAANVFGIASFAFQCVRLRAVSQPILWDDAIVFLANKICGFDEEDMDSFGRKPSSFTMMFSFLATPEETNTFNVKVEAYDQAQKNLTMDVEGTFAGPITREDLARGAENIQKTYDFIAERTMGFLNRYDHQAEQQ